MQLRDKVTKSFFEKYLFMIALDSRITAALAPAVRAESHLWHWIAQDLPV
jgi:hypothetical protein